MFQGTMIQSFEIEFFEVMVAKHQDTLNTLRKGIIGDNETALFIETVAS